LPVTDYTDNRARLRAGRGYAALDHLITARAAALFASAVGPGPLVDRRLHLALEDLGGTGKRLVECWFDGGLADHDEPRLASKAQNYRR
jgi:hypothetical protein